MAALGVWAVWGNLDGVGGIWEGSGSGLGWGVWAVPGSQSFVFLKIQTVQVWMYSSVV